jgi:CheY-like chemotaxis protein
MSAVRRERFLVVDDNPVVRFVIGQIAERHGASVTFATDGEEAQDAIRKGERFDAVFLDLLMPNASGWDVLNMIQENPETTTTPVYIVSGAPISPEEKKRLRGRTAGFLDKGAFDVDEFDNWIGGVVSNETTGALSPA